MPNGQAKVTTIESGREEVVLVSTASSPPPVPPHLNEACNSMSLQPDAPSVLPRESCRRVLVEVVTKPQVGCI
ncbi:unnamed protein product [Protopolystoma xenopodis]|uniref:Uncharacterized protein n=1 Tax=Protopolystoma xenopodis TaxID=117903 RepID=A0A448XL39_9PLAT|nr:unnamed protein product [Protopolystoma xenopodis]